MHNKNSVSLFIIGTYCNYPLAFFFYIQTTKKNSMTKKSLKIKSSIAWKKPEGESKFNAAFCLVGFDLR